MADDANEFSRLVSAVLDRFLTQNGKLPPAGFRAEEFGARLWEIVSDHTRSASARPATGDSVGTSEPAWAALTVRALGGLNDETLAVAAQQLLKTCLYPELRTCRDSFKEVGVDGKCRRQELARVRGRISGTHCVDCPHWVNLDPTSHAAFLRSEWRGNCSEFIDHQSEFLPEDFRALRRWLNARPRVRSSVAR